MISVNVSTNKKGFSIRGGRFIDANGVDHQAVKVGDQWGDERIVSEEDRVVEGTTGPSQRLVSEGLEGNAWVKLYEAYTPDPTPPPVPSSITPLQARKILRAYDLYDSAQAWIATQSPEVQDEWEFALSIDRTNTTLMGAAVALGLTEAQLDQMFIEASVL